MRIDFTQIKLINDLALTRSTGALEQLAKHLGVSVRSLSTLIKFMGEDLDAPIKYDATNLTYYYLETGSLNSKFQKDKEVAARILNIIYSSL